MLIIKLRHYFDHNILALPAIDMACKSNLYTFMLIIKLRHYFYCNIIALPVQDLACLLYLVGNLDCKYYLLILK